MVASGMKKMYLLQSKNFKLHVQRKILTCVEFLIPVLLTLNLVVARGFVSPTHTANVKHYASLNIQLINLYRKGGIGVAYVPKTAATERIMESVQQYFTKTGSPKVVCK